MTEQEWLDCTDPDKMLEFLTGKVSERKLRLFACACVRRILAHASVVRSGWVVEIAERQADGLATEGDWATAASLAGLAANDDQNADLAVWSLFLSWSGGAAGGAAVAASDARAAARDAAWAAVIPLTRPHRDAGKAAARIAARREQATAAAEASERQAQAALLRHLFGCPPRPVALDPVWQTPDLLAIAQTTYEERILPAGILCSSRLAVLADALEDAGCTDEEILSHLRGPGPHVRGCWLVDVLTQRE